MNLLKNINYFAVSDIGRNRKRNEDSYTVYESSAGGTGPEIKGILFVVADGIGGHTCGDVASQVACGGLATFFCAASNEFAPEELLRKMEKLIHSIDALIRERAAGDPACADMGSTLSAFLIADGFGVIAHVGDSRIYRLREGHLRQLTTDHTFVQEVIEAGELTREVAVNHPFRNVLTRAVGTPEPLEAIEIKTIEIEPGDRFLLASDGLHDMAAYADIKIILEGSGGPEPAVRQLVAAALQNGGKDNVTVIVVDL